MFLIIEIQHTCISGFNAFGHSERKSNYNFRKKKNLEEQYDAEVCRSIINNTSHMFKKKSLA